MSWRSVTLGLTLSIGIVCITPYNDYVVNNSFIVNNYVPTILTLAMLAIVLLVNGPLHKWAPRFAMSPGELAVVLTMALLSCSIPSQGLLRQVLPMPVAPFALTASDPNYKKVFDDMDLPPAMFAVEDMDKGHMEPVVTHFYGRVPEGEKIPWHRWLRPAVVWGALSGFFLLALLSIACLVRYQWTVNERLAFPIAQLQSMLIAPPRPGKALNDVFRHPGFWVSVGVVIFVQASAWLHQYFPKNIPEIPTSYDLRTMFSEQPWNYLAGWVKEQGVIFTLVGISYFTPTRVSFSLWGTALLMALIAWPLAAQNSTAMDGAALNDQALGAAFAFIGGVLWIGRHHWAMVGRAIIGAARPNDAHGVFVSYRLAALGLAIGVVGMFAWFLWAGCVWWLAVVLVLMIVMAHVITARVVAETGLAFIRVPVGMNQILTNLDAKILTPRDAYLYGIAHYGFMQAAREGTLTFALHGLNVVDDTDASEKDKHRLMPILMGTLVIAVIAGGLAGLWCYYSYAIPLDPHATNMTELNQWGLRLWPNDWLKTPVMQVDAGVFPKKAYNSWLHIGIGIGVMVVLQAMTWRFSGWPLLPVGYLIANSWYTQTAALSLFIGWLAKTIILRFGGATLFNNLKPVFIGLIFGEALSTGLWLIITLIRALNGLDFYVVRFMPQ